MPGSSLFRTVAHCFRTIVPVVIDLIRLAVFTAHSRRALAAENLFLRKQLALFQERKVKPRRANDSARLLMVILSRMFPWRGFLVNVKADTFIRWHHKGLRLFWRWKSKPTGRPRLAKEIRRLIREMAAENTTWGEERIADELQLKLGIRVSPRSITAAPHEYFHHKGAELLAAARRSLEEFDGAIARIGERVRESSQTLSIGAGHIVAANILPLAMK